MVAIDFLYLIISLSSPTLVTAARRDWNFDLYPFNLQFYSTFYFFFLSATTLYIYSNYTISLLQWLFRRLQCYCWIGKWCMWCMFRISFIYSNFMYICIFSGLKRRTKVKLEKWGQQNVTLPVSDIF